MDVNFRNISLYYDMNTIIGDYGNSDSLEYTPVRSEEHTSELQSHSFTSYAVFCLKKK